MKCWIQCIPPKSTAQSTSMIMYRGKGSERKPFVGSAGKGQKVREEIMGLLQSFTPVRPYEGPLRLGVYWVFPFRKNEKKADRERGYDLASTRPDVDNLSKFLCDCMGRLGWFLDDSQICHLSFRKYRSHSPGIGISLEHITPEQVGNPSEFMGIRPGYNQTHGG